MANFLSRFVGGTSKKEDASVRKGVAAQLNWILPQQLAVGPIPLGEQRQTLILEQGIRSMLTLCSEAEGTPPYKLCSQVSWTRLVLPDSHCSESVDVADFAKAVDQAYEYIQAFAPLYVHCVAGMERSPSVCVGYLYKYRGMELWEALNWVKQANPRTNILDSQLKAIQSLKP